MTALWIDAHLSPAIANWVADTPSLTQNTTRRTGKMILGLSERTSYTDLLVAFPPRPIETEEQFWATQKVIDSLIDKSELTKDEEDYIDLQGVSGCFL